MDTNELVAERHNTHGLYDHTASIYKNIGLALACPAIRKMDPAFLMSMDMITVKLARIVSGDPDFRDHWDDIAGYAKLAADRCSK